jgi:hypothetical protein
METNLVVLTPVNCTARMISRRNNVVVNYTDPMNVAITVVIHKKYFNQIVQGEVLGRLRTCDDGLVIFEGFNFN